MISKHHENELRTLIKNIQDGTFGYEGHEPVKTKWSPYGSAQIKGMTCYLDNLKDLVD